MPGEASSMPPESSSATRAPAKRKVTGKKAPSNRQELLIAFSVLLGINLIYLFLTSSESEKAKFVLQYVQKSGIFQLLAVFTTATTLAAGYFLYKKKYPTYIVEPSASAQPLVASVAKNSNKVTERVPVAGDAAAEDVPVAFAEREALVRLFHTTGGGLGCWKTSWDLSLPPKEWAGVSVDKDTGAVTKLILASNGLTGTTIVLAKLLFFVWILIIISFIVQ
jgi:hypothetical protein